jgi:predicted Zn-dependent protease
LAAAALALAALGAVAGAFLTAQTTPSDTLLQAMRDELERSRKLTVPNLEAPYFIQYAIDQGEVFTVAATLGGIVTRRRDRFRIPEIRVRVGDYKFDNTNYVGAGFGFGSRYETGRFPVEDDYAVFRRFLWLETDSAYKSAVEAISRKRAALRNLTLGEQINDFAHAEPVKSYRDLLHLTIDEKAWTDRVRSLSGIFDRFPEVRNSSLELESGEGGYYLVTSEGTELRMRDGVTFLRVRAGAQAPDGMLVRDAAVFHSRDAARMPLDPDLRREITAVAEHVVALAHAPRGDDYSGPVLFEGMAAAQLFAEVLGRNLALTRRPVMEPGRPGNFPISELEGRQGARILPEWMDVVDDPTQVEWRGRPLFGSYEVDREGVVPKPLRLVEKGVLKDFLRTRQPVRGYEGSNGRARMPGSFGAQQAGFSNLFVSAAESVPPADLKKQMLELLRSRNKPYGVIVRKMDFPSSAPFDEVRRLLAGSQSSSSRPVSLPSLAYRIYPDGREELIRGVRFRGLNARSLKDILAAGNDVAVFDYLDNGAPFAVMGAGSFAAESCVAAPSVLIDDLELHPLEDEHPKLPVAPPPELVH